jgi:hypothetical protein
LNKPITIPYGPLSASWRDTSCLLFLSSPPVSNFHLGGFVMPDATIPADLLELKARLEAWRTSRQHLREPLPAELRQAVAEMSRRYSPSLIRRLLKLDPWRLISPATKKPARTRHQLNTAFFTLPPDALLPEPGLAARQTAAGCRLQLERPDGARLTLMLPALDLLSLNRLCADFLRT